MPQLSFQDRIQLKSKANASDITNVIKGVAETKGMNRAAGPIDFNTLSEQ